MEDNESDDDSIEIMDDFTKGEGTGLAHGVGGNRVGCTSSSLVKLELHQCPKKDGGVAENLVRANAFKLENPLFTVTIHPSYIDGKDRAILPRAIINYLPREGFTKDYNKGSILTVKLQVVDRLWPMKLYIYERSVGSSCVISAGWSTVARENTLRVGDVCVFELIMRDDVVLKRSAQKKVVDPSVGPSKTPRVRSITGDVPNEDMHGDPTTAIAEDGDDEVDVDTADAAHIGPLPPSLHAMIETIKTTQVAHG
nr:b3 domain-containing transcription factor vrn1 [Quercus suber]